MFDPCIVLGLGLPFCDMGRITLPSSDPFPEGHGNEAGHQKSHVQATGSLDSPDSSRGEPTRAVCQGDSYELTLPLSAVLGGQRSKGDEILATLEVQTVCLELVGKVTRRCQ